MLTDAVVIIPCAHKIQECVAKTIFGEATVEGWRINREAICPMYRRKVEGYSIDHSMRNIVKEIFNQEQKSLGRIIYPGISGKFLHNRGDWSVFNSGGNLCWEMKFKSITPNSLIKKFSVLGYSDSSVVIHIDYEKKNFQKIRFYLQHFDIVINEPCDNYSCRSKTLDQLVTIFNIFAQNNDIPVDNPELRSLFGLENLSENLTY